MIKYFEYKVILNTDFINKTELLSIISKVANPIINSIKNDIYKLFFSQSEEKKLLFNESFEIFVKDKVLCIIDFEKNSFIKLGFITYTNDYEKILEMFKRVLEKYLQTKNISFDISEQKTHFNLFYPIDNSILLNSDLNAFSNLTNERYNILKNISGLGTKIYKREISKFLEIKPELIEELVRLDFLQREFVFICKESGRQIIQLANLDILHTNPDAVKCFYCGKNLKDETMEEVISLSNLANETVRDNMWVAAVIYKALTDNGITELVADSVEIGKVIISTHLSEPTVLFILKEDFKIHNVFLLDIYLSNYKTKYVIMVTLSPNASIIKDYIVQKGIRVVLIDSYENINSNIINAIQEISRMFVRDKLEEYNNYFSFKISDLISTEYPVIQKVETPTI
ncbi:MAG: hypothetical protein N2169_05130 [bacterium]|nr:hypothetical protein [bacterium]